MNHYEAKQEARRERLEAAAENARAEANQRYNAARQMAEVIPFGQPILIGHHSEKRDRNYRGRIENNFRKSFEADQRAKELAAKAAAVGTAGISGDDPDAPTKLAERIAELEARQANMKAVNAAHKRFLKDPATLDKAALSDDDKDRIRRYVTAYSWEPHPFPPYAMSNNNANLKRLKDRVKHIAARPAEDAEVIVGEVRVVQNAGENRTQVFFPGKPSEKVRAELKAHGFRWSPLAGAWQRHLSSGAQYLAQKIAERVQAGEFA